jgi:nucleoside-diphosphate-sugar epimerase
LLERDYEVHAVAFNGDRARLDGVQWHRADLLDPCSISHLVASVAPSHLLHFAWFAVPGEYQASEENFRWCQAGIELMQQFAAAGGRRAVFAGTCFEYDFAYGYCSENLTPCVPATRYGAAKFALAQLLTRFPPAGISTALGRIFHLYGPHEHPNRLVSSVIYSLLRGGRAQCTHGRQVRDFMHVADVADAFVELLDSDVAGIVNIGSGEPVTIHALVTRIAAMINAEGQVEFGAISAAPSDPPVLVPNVRRLREEVGWAPHFSLNHGLAHTIDWWRTRPAA